MKNYLIIVATIFFPGIASAGQADIVTWCSNETGAPSNIAFSAISMPDGKLRGTRSAAELTAEARKAKAAGDCNTAIEWLLHCVDHDEGAQNEIRANTDAACGLL